MIPEDQKDCLKAMFCCCVRPSRVGHELYDDDRFVTFPEYVGNHILCWGKKNSQFPAQCFLGPDWPVVLLTYAMIIGINVIVLAVVSPLGWPLVLVGAITCCILLYFYSATVGTESGIIFKKYGAVSSSRTVDSAKPATIINPELVSMHTTSDPPPAVPLDDDSARVQRASGASEADETTPAVQQLGEQHQQQHQHVQDKHDHGDIECGEREHGENNHAEGDECDSTRHLIGSSVNSTQQASTVISTVTNPASVHPTGGFSVYPGTGGTVTGYSSSSTGSHQLPPITVQPYVPAVPSTIECGQCDLQRPYSARHCSMCKVCVDGLDHHCPWCGKCIGEKNIKQFYCFVGWLQFQMYYLFGLFVYFIVAQSLNN